MSASSSGCVLEMWVGRGEVPTDGVTVKRVKKGRGGDCQRFITPLPQGRTLSLFNRGSKLIDTICQAALLVLQLCEALGGWQGDGRGGTPYICTGHHFHSETQGICEQTEKCKQFLSSKESLGKQSFPVWGAGGFGEEVQRMFFLV